MEVTSDQTSGEDELCHDMDLGIRILWTRGDKLGRDGFHMTTELCIQLLRDAMLLNQWDRAARLISSYFQTLEDRNNSKRLRAPEVIWRVGNEILLNHPNSSPEEIRLFNETMKNVGVKNYLKISLEQIYFLLCNDQIDEAYRLLCLAGSWHWGRPSSSDKALQKLIQAYKALLDHRKWLSEVSAVDENGLNYASMASRVHDTTIIFQQASIPFNEIRQFPGVWDPFILSYVDMLVYSSNIEEAEKVLTEYVNYKYNPANPNAHVYLYQFLNKHGASTERQLQVLKKLHTLVPSHRLMLKLNKLLAASGSEEDGFFALRVLFDLLDFCSWKEDAKAWKYLAKQIKKALSSDHSAWVSALWESRRDWWPAYHFTKSQVKKDHVKSTKLAVKKASVAGMLQGPGSIYFSWVCRMNTDQQNTLNDMKKFIRKHKCARLGSSPST